MHLEYRVGEVVFDISLNREDFIEEIVIRINEKGTNVRYSLSKHTGTVASSEIRKVKNAK